MTQESSTAGSSWHLGRSAILELDIAIWLLSQREEWAILDELVAPLAATTDAALLAELPELFGSAQPGPGTLLIDWANLAGVLAEPEYSRATLPMRELSPAAALATSEAAAPKDGTAGAAASQDRDGLQARLHALLAAQTAAIYSSLSLESSAPEAVTHKLGQTAGQLMRVMAGGDLHARFWHWMDRFYYEAYRPWQESRAAFLQAEEARVVSALGAHSGAGVPPLAWLSPQNPLRNRSGVRSAVAEERFDVFFLLEPFGLVDLLEADAGTIFVTVGEPGPTYTAFRAMAEDVARRTKALADPTRLIILRLIRNFSMDNTEMADFLEIARPTVSVHAKILREAGLIATHQVGRQARHEIDAAAVRRLFRDLENFLDLPEHE